MKRSIGSIRPFLGITFIAAAMLAVPGRAAAVNLVTNGDFETGDFTGWFGSATTGGFDGVTCGSGLAGDCSAFFAASGSDDTLQQTLSTVAGAHYAISFLLKGDGGVPSDFSVTFGSQTLLGLNPVASGTRTYAFDAVATGSSTLLSFSMRNDPGFLMLDSVVVAVPEPSALSLLGISLAAMWAALRYRDRKGRRVVAPSVG